MKLKLRPFHQESHDPKYITATILPQPGHHIELQFDLEFHEPSQILAHGEIAIGEPCDHLYENTCFELFIRSGKAYLEWNIAPNGAWYAYAFSDYRQNKIISLESFRPLSFKSDISQNRTQIYITLPWQPLRTYLSVENTIAIKPSMVLKPHEKPSYWTTEHPQDKADFHADLGWSSFSLMNKNF